MQALWNSAAAAASEFSVAILLPTLCQQEEEENWKGCSEEERRVEGIHCFPIPYSGSSRTETVAQERSMRDPSTLWGGTHLPLHPFLQPGFTLASQLTFWKEATESPEIEEENAHVRGPEQRRLLPPTAFLLPKR